jgi:Flp pilus assembly pilin Flp
MIRSVRTGIDDRGQDAVEYVLLVMMIALAITASLTMLATSVDTTYQNAATCISSTALGSTPAPGNGGGTGAPGQGKGKGGGKGAGNPGSGQTGCP